jgi:hypothetical protein
MRIFLFAFCCFAFVCSAAPGADPITTESLVAEMVDLAGLGDFPDPPFETVQFSSYDRRSEAPNTPGWYANSDGFGSEPIPGFLAVLKPPGADGVGEYLMTDVEGPGAIVRGWTAAISGELRVFLDGHDEPVYAGPANVFLFDRFAHFAQRAGLSVESPGDAFRQQDADYFPIPFAKGCRIEWKGNLRDIHFYHLQVRKYPPGTEVKTFQVADLKTYANEIRRAISLLQEPPRLLEGIEVTERLPLTASIRAAQRAEVAKRETGPAAVRQLVIKLEANDLRSALRQTILRIAFDGAPFPQVESPVGDFFGAAPGINPHDTFPMTVMPDGTMVCRFIMPYAKSLSLAFDNRGKQTVKVTGEVILSPYKWQADRSMHFRARWRADHDLLTVPGPGVFDLPFLVASGKGVYVGTAVMLMNPSPVPTAYGNWWGEGDEKIFVDGEAFPSTFGTGSEDYFNYSWSRCDLFEHPYCAQPIVTGPDTRGYTSNSRWHILDPLPFEKEIAFYMEVFSHNPVPGLSYARTAYHYARPGIRDDCVPITDSDARVVPLPANWEPAGSHGSAGAVFYQAESLEVKGDGEITVEEGELWSAGKLLVWKPAKKGDKLSLTLTVAAAGRYAIVMTCEVSPRSGSFAASCDGNPLIWGNNERIFNLRSSHQTMLRNFIYNPVNLKPGDHVLELEATDEGLPGSTIGLDFIWLHPRR